MSARVMKSTVTTTSPETPDPKRLCRHGDWLLSPVNDAHAMSQPAPLFVSNSLHHQPIDDIGARHGYEANGDEDAESNDAWLDDGQAGCSGDDDDGNEMLAQFEREAPILLTLQQNTPQYARTDGVFEAHVDFLLTGRVPTTATSAASTVTTNAPNKPVVNNNDDDDDDGDDSHVKPAAAQPEPDYRLTELEHTTLELFQPLFSVVSAANGLDAALALEALPPVMPGGTRPKLGLPLSQHPSEPCLGCTVGVRTERPHHICMRCVRMLYFVRDALAALIELRHTAGVLHAPEDVLLLERLTATVRIAYQLLRDKPVRLARR